MTSTATIEQAISDRDFRLVTELVYQHCGIRLHDGKKPLVQARLARELRRTGLSSYRSYLEMVLSDPSSAEFKRFIDSLSTNLTSFFREPRHFDYLREILLPQIADRRRDQSRPVLRGWSAGCSTGEEPYSIAITILETPGIEWERWDALLLATDISTTVLETARRGEYPPERLRGVPAGWRSRYFGDGPSTPGGGQSACRQLRRMIHFRYLNLVDDWPFSGPFDFIFCRNVMIYFDKPTQQRLVQRFHDVLDRGGVLFTGHSESLTGINHGFTYVEPTIYRKD